MELYQRGEPIYPGGPNKQPKHQAPTISSIDKSLSRNHHQQVKTEDKCTFSTQTRVNWKKVYQDLYAALAKHRFPQIKITANTAYDLEKAVTSVNQVLSKCANDAGPRQHRWAGKTNLECGHLR